MKTSVGPMREFIASLAIPMVIVMLVALPFIILKEPPSWMPVRLFKLCPVANIIAMCVLMCSLFIGTGNSERRRKRALEHGTPTRALILKVETQGYSRRGASALLTLEVQPKDGSSFRTESSLYVGVGDPGMVFSPGETLTVFVDPEDPTRVVVPPPGRLLKTSQEAEK